MADKGSQLLERPLYVFDLPEEIISTLTVKQSSKVPVQSVVEETTRRKEKVTPEPRDDGTPAKATSCNLCGLSFANVQEQRDHIRSDLHGYNLKQKLKGLKPVGEAEFERLIGELDESISGSESSDSESDADDGQATSGKSNLSALLEKQARLSPGPDVEISGTKRKRGAGKPPLLWFTTPVLPENTSLGVYRAIFSDSVQAKEPDLVEALLRKQLVPSKAPNSASKQNDTGGVPLPGAQIGPHYFLCMIGGGHFAAMVIALTPKIGKKHTGVAERQATVIAHKTFHRYTTRRKQGGAQSANDNAKGNAHSAGSSLRRYNEAALTQEVRELLSQWKPMIDSAELLFVRATGSTNRNTLFGPYEGQVLRHNDPRNRGFPFSTRRATQAELMRCFVELTRVKVSQIDEAALAAAAAEAAQKEELSRSSTPKKAVDTSPAKSKEDEVAALHTNQLVALVRRSKAPAVLSYLSSNDLPASFNFFPASSQQNYHAPTPLHLAASINSAVVVSALLTKAQADPTILNGEGKTPFELAGDRATRDAFRVARRELGESKWDWSAAQVPTALSKSDADKRAERERQEEAAESAKEKARRKAETERLRAETEKAEQERIEKRIGKGRVVSAVPEKTGAEKREEEARGMTPEMRQRLERERRARAAEERIRRMQQG
ncbi:hypothetical protein NA57DRAFT_54825 [Rhizodiscina lignyota]|uniref:VLRF1 domain-containing protein n=1 Tax=Rhizodiscina lignyota TaxID=1504668 RepID=A0A9P4M7J0_9PEZI|nr:hypothetical protein NA57DRAFT_54825 [Rhizodiscina lignyota]